MKRVMVATATVVGLGVALVLGQLALIEIGREVVLLRTRLPDAGWWETRLWVVDYNGAVWLHSAGKDWLRRFDGDPIVELERHGEIRRYRAHALPGPHLQIDRLLREKYGLADHWVRFLAPCGEDTVPVRLEPLPR